jgi:hypothetical protein
LVPLGEHLLHCQKADARWQKSSTPSPAMRAEANSSKSGSSVSAIASNEVAADVQTVETGHAADNADVSGVGRAQPFGQPVIRMLRRSRSSP